MWNSVTKKNKQTNKNEHTETEQKMECKRNKEIEPIEKSMGNKNQNLHPTSITQMVKIFSASVFGATLPKPTDVNDVNVK